MFPLKMGLRFVPLLHMRVFFQIDGLISSNVNFGHLIRTCLLPFDLKKLFEKSVIYECCQASCKSIPLELIGPIFIVHLWVYF